VIDVITVVKKRYVQQELSEDEEIEVSHVRYEETGRLDEMPSQDNSLTSTDKNSSYCNDFSVSTAATDSAAAEDRDREEQEGDSFSRRTSMRMGVREKRSSKRNYSDRRKKMEYSRKQDASPSSSFSSMTMPNQLLHPRALDALPPGGVRPEDLRLNLNSLDSSSVSDFRSMEASSLEILQTTHL
jgi:hypothetical protein